MKFLRRIFNRYLSRDRYLANNVREIIGITPASLHLYKLAFSHKSNNHSDDAYGQQNNERLEYLGDAVLGTIVAEYLYHKYPNRDEGFLTQMRSKCVKRKALNEVGEAMRLDEQINQMNHGLSISRSMLGNALEALIGALYVDYGYDVTRKIVIARVLRNHFNIHELELFDDNYKSQLLEYCQKNGDDIEYKLLERSKRENRDRFKVAVLINKQTCGIAEDYNKKNAEQRASEFALRNLGLLHEMVDE